jgi:hypothetical protein
VYVTFNTTDAQGNPARVPDASRAQLYSEYGVGPFRLKGP